MKAVSSKLRYALLAALLLLAFLLRSCGLSHDLDQGNVYHPDTPKQIYAVQRFLAGEYQFKTGNINYDGYPFFNSRVIELGVRAYNKTGNALRSHMGIADPIPIPARAALFWLVRLLNAGLSTATVLLAFLIARRVFNSRAGLLAALLTALSPLAVISCHDAMSDSTAIFFAVLAIFFAVRIYDEVHWSDYLFAGLAAAFSFAAKYHGGIALLPCLLAHAMRYRSAKNIFSRASISRLILLATAGTTGFIFATPAFLAEPIVTIDNIMDFFSYTSNFGMRPEMKSLSLPARWCFGLAHNIPDFFKLLSPPVFLLLIPGTLYELWRRPRTLLLASLPLVYIFLALPFKPLTHPQYHGMAMPLLFVLAAGIMTDLWTAKRMRIPARITTLTAILIAVSMLSVQTHEDNFYYRCRDTRLIADYWLKDNVPASFQIAAGHYTLTYTPKNIVDPRGRAMLTSDFRPHPPPDSFAFSNRIDLKDEGFELFRNPVITSYVHDSGWLTGDPIQPAYLSVASPHSGYPVLTESKSLLRTPRVMALNPGVPRQRMIFAEHEIDEVLLVYRNGERPTRFKMELGGDRHDLKVEAFARGQIGFSPRRTVLSTENDRYVYELAAKSENSFSEIRLAFTREEKGVALYQIGDYARALPHLQSAFEGNPSPTVAAMIVASADHLGVFDSIAAPVRRMARRFAETEWCRASIIENYAIAPDYLESLPYIELDLSRMPLNQDEMPASRIIFLPPGAYRLSTIFAQTIPAKDISSRAVDARTGRELPPGQGENGFIVPEETEAVRIIVERAKLDAGAGGKLEIKPDIAGSMLLLQDILARISRRIPAASAGSTAIAAQIAQAADCSMSIHLHRRLTDLNHTDSTLHALATKSCEKSGLEEDE